MQVVQDTVSYEQTKQPLILHVTHFPSAFKVYPSTHLEQEVELVQVLQ